MSPKERAEKAIELMRANRNGILCTHSERMDGYPYGSNAPYAVTARNEPFFFLSGLAVHTKNLRHQAKASLLITENTNDGGRMNLFGEVLPVADEAEVVAMREIYLRQHPEAKQWIDFGDFQFYKLHVANIYWVGGFGEMGWIDPQLVLG